MKSEHRHELKTNELAEWIANFPQWAQENAKTILCVSTIVAVVGLFYVYRSYNKKAISKKQFELTSLITQLPKGKTQILQAQDRGIDISYMLIQIADKFKALARDTKDDQMAALALIKQAETLRMELHYRLETAHEQEITTQINKAKASYTEALEKSSPNPSLMATAKFGLGLCEEELGNFKEAKQIYRDISANPNFEGTVAAVQAKLRLDTMADYQRKVVFRQPPKQMPTDLVKPQIRIKATDSNLPSK